MGNTHYYAVKYARFAREQNKAIEKLNKVNRIYGKVSRWDAFTGDQNGV